MKHYCIAIGYTNGKGYRKVISRHETRLDAIAACLERKPSFHAYVYRDGETGKRYSQRECRELRKDS